MRVVTGAEFGSVPCAALATVLLVAVACGGGAQDGKTRDTGTATAGAATLSPAVDVWQTLEARPLRLPILAAGRTCPVVAPKAVSPAYAPGLGDGPVYAVIGGSTLEFGYSGDFAGSEWGGQKVLWTSDATYRGPALVRGHQLDGPNEVRFETGTNPAAKLQLTDDGWASSPQELPGWREWPSYTRVRAPGCYAYQVDAPDFSEVIVFSAKPAPY